MPDVERPPPAYRPLDNLPPPPYNNFAAHTPCSPSHLDERCPRHPGNCKELFTSYLLHKARHEGSEEICWWWWVPRTIVVLAAPIGLFYYTSQRDARKDGEDSTLEYLPAWPLIAIFCIVFLIRDILMTVWGSWLNYRMRETRWIVGGDAEKRKGRRRVWIWLRSRGWICTVICAAIGMGLVQVLQSGSNVGPVKEVQGV